MQYRQVVSGIFQSRPNRFIACVEINGQIEKCHVKNTGRCRELLLPGVRVYLEKSDNPARKTAYSLIAVEKQTEKGILLINMDSQAPNQAVKEWLGQGGGEEVFGSLCFLRPEKNWGDSRFDFYLETDQGRWFLEVKGVTLEQDGIVRFPDAPTERGIKHLKELIRCQKEGYKAAVCFVIQMEKALYFAPNWLTHAAFAQTLREAESAGVKILARRCLVTPDSMEIASAVPIHLEE